MRLVVAQPSSVVPAPPGRHRGACRWRPHRGYAATRPRGARDALGHREAAKPRQRHHVVHAYTRAASERVRNHIVQQPPNARIFTRFPCSHPRALPSAPSAMFATIMAASLSLPPTASAPPPAGTALGAPPPAAPPLVAGLRKLLTDVPGCHAPCVERAEDWFEQARRWGASSVESMVRLGLVQNFASSLALDPEAEDIVLHRLSQVPTVLAPKAPKMHDET